MLGPHPQPSRVSRVLRGLCRRVWAPRMELRPVNGCDDTDLGQRCRSGEQVYVVLPAPGCWAHPRSQPGPMDPELCHPGSLSLPCRAPQGRAGQTRRAVDKRSKVSPGWRKPLAHQSAGKCQGRGRHRPSITQRMFVETPPQA